MKSTVAKKTTSVLVKMNIQNGGRGGRDLQSSKSGFSKNQPPESAVKQLQHQQKMTSGFNADTFV